MAPSRDDLYEYLREKAQRVGQLEREDRAEARRERLFGALATSMADAASSMGTLGGKRADSSSVARFVEQSGLGEVPEQGRAALYEQLAQKAQAQRAQAEAQARSDQLAQSRFERTQGEVERRGHEASALAREKFEWEKRRAAAGEGGRQVWTLLEGSDDQGQRFERNQATGEVRPASLPKNFKTTAERTAEAKPRQLSVVQKAIDDKFGKDYADYVAQGGYADIQKQLTQLREAANRLSRTNTASGPLVSIAQSATGGRFSPEGTAIKEMIEEVVQRDLRRVLGAQFTEKEGDRLISRAFNPRLSEAENLRRLERLIESIQLAADAKEAAAKHVQEHGTLSGFTGHLASSVNDFDKFDDAPETKVVNGKTYRKVPGGWQEVTQ